MPFEIFSSEEIAEIEQHISSPELKSSVNMLFKRINVLMNHEKIGWINKVRELANKHGSLTDAEKKEIYTGAGLYLETANKLQKPAAGSEEKITLGNKVITQVVSVYNAFWNHCEEDIYYSFLIETNELIQKKPLEPQFAKAYIFCLLTIKTVTFPSFNSFQCDESLKSNQMYITQIAKNLKQQQDYIDSLVERIVQDSKIDKTFKLNAQEEDIVTTLQFALRQRLATLRDLKAFVESEPYFLRYVHVRPALIIQIAQALDYIYKKISEEEEPMSLIDNLFKKKKNVVFDLLHRKRQEIASVLHFQEVLKENRDSDDFIEILHQVVGNIRNKLLPTSILFHFDKNLPICIFNPSEDDSPKLIEEKDWSPYRKTYVQLHAANKTNVLFSMPYNQKLKQEYIHKKLTSSIQNENIIPTKMGYYVTQLSPDFVIEIEKETKQEAKEHKSVDQHFFITQAKAIRPILEINTLGLSIDFLYRQASNNVTWNLHTKFDKNNPELTILLPATSNRLLLLIKAISFLKNNYDNILKQLITQQAISSSVSEKMLMQNDIDIIWKIGKNLDQKIQCILVYFLKVFDELSKRSLSTVSGELIDLLNNAISSFQNSKLKDMLNDRHSAKSDDFIQKMVAIAR